MPYTDAELVRRVRDGDHGAYGQVIDRYQQRLIASAHHLLGELDLARDAVQETFIEGYRHLRDLREPTRLGAWLFSILRHRAYDLLSKRRHAISWEEEMADEWYAPAEMDESIDLPELLSRLPVNDREVLAARYLQELSYDEIAHVLGINAKTARVRVCRAKERLRALLARAEEEVGL